MKINQDEKIIVIGHKNPDTDSICSAIAYADLKNKMGGGAFEACRCGDVSLETQYVLDTFGVPAPRLVQSVATDIGDLEIDPIPGLPEETSMREAWKAMRGRGSASQPIVDAAGNLRGMITLNDLAKGNMDNLDPAVLAEAHTPLQNVVQILRAKVLAGDPDFVIEKGRILVGAGGPDTMRELVQQDDLVLVSDREAAQKAAIEAGAAVVVICLGAKVSDEILQLAGDRGCHVIVTENDTYQAARLITQAVPLSAFMTEFGKLVGFVPETAVDSVQKVMESSRHISFPVYTAEGKYLGVITRGSLLTQKGKQMILVDHNEKSQCVDGFEEAEILEIVDHHKIGTIETSNPVLFINRPVGCTATIIYGLYQQECIEIEPKIAGLLLSAILSDTLDFRSPTCTETDRKVGAALAEIAGVDAHEHALAMFTAGENMEGRTAEDLCYADYKIFEKDGVRFGVGQGSFMSPANLQKALDLVEPFLAETLQKDGTEMVFFMGTDILESSSRVIFAGADAKQTVEKAFQVTQAADEQGVYLQGVVSRKKQMIPALMSVIG